MRPIRIKFTDFPGPFNPVRILGLLKAQFSVEQVDSEPDYLIFSVFGNDVLQERDAVRIFFTGENAQPDFNLCDYAFGYDWLELGDRYYRWPNYQFYEHYKEICQRRVSSLTRERLASRKPHFCNFVYSNPHVIPYRDALFHALNRYRVVHSAGPHLNNVGFTPGRAYKDDWPGAKVEFQRAYKFSIACENSSTPGYTTEKIVHALAADTIPIYFGNPLVTRDFNPKRFINCHDFDSLEAVVARVAEVDQNDELYLEIMSEPFFAGGQVPAYLTDDALCERFRYIFRQPRPAAYRRNFYHWGPLYEDRRRREAVAAAALSGVAAKLGGIAESAPPEVKTQLVALQKQLAELSGE